MPITSPRKAPSGLWWAVGGVTVVGLFVFLRGRQSASTAASSGPTGQVPTSIGPALDPNAAGPGNSDDSTTYPQGDTGTDAYEPADTASALGYTSGTYGAPAYSGTTGNSLAPLSILPGPTSAQSSGPTLYNPGGFAANPGGGYNPGGGLVLAPGGAGQIAAGIGKV